MTIDHVILCLSFLCLACVSLLTMVCLKCLVDLQIWSNFLGEFDLQITERQNQEIMIKIFLEIRSIYNSEMVCLKCLVDLQILANFFFKFGQIS